MKVKIISPIATARGKLKPGDILEVKPRVAERWIVEGLARKVRR